MVERISGGRGSLRTGIRLPDDPVPAYDLEQLFEDREVRRRIGELIARAAQSPDSKN